MRRKTVALVSLAVLAGLAGCSDSTASATFSPTVTATTSSTPTPSPTPTPSVTTTPSPQPITAKYNDPVRLASGLSFWVQEPAENVGEGTIPHYESEVWGGEKPGIISVFGFQNVENTTDKTLDLPHSEMTILSDGESYEPIFSPWWCYRSRTDNNEEPDLTEVDPGEYCERGYIAGIPSLEGTQAKIVSNNTTIIFGPEIAEKYRPSFFDE